MSDEFIPLHNEILSEFEKRLKSSDDIPDEVVVKLQETENFGLDSSNLVKAAIEDGISDETD